MRSRCYRKTHVSYPWYGALGVTVCDRWNNSFASFLGDMGRKPSPDMSLDRIKSNGNYEPENCRWATKDVQSNNRKSNIIVEYQGQRMTLAQATRLAGVSYPCAHRNLLKGPAFGIVRVARPAYL